MTHFTRFQRVATAAVGAIVISTAFVGAAVGPAAVAGSQPTEVSVAQHQVPVQAHA